MKTKYLSILCSAMLMTLAACSDNTPDEPKPNTPNTDEPTEEPTEDFTLDIPDVSGATIKGVVYCNDKPVAGAVVSDGDLVVTTDANGRYYINSQKRWGSVFVSIPSGYWIKEAKSTVWPTYYYNLTADASTVEQHNFELATNEETDYVVIGFADPHVANVRSTTRQYLDNMLPDINQTIADYQAQGKSVYCITLGDMSHDLYWYSKGLAIEESKLYLEYINANAIFGVMGNHDNDPYVASDFAAEDRYRATYGPTHYSFNIAGTHYVILDNIVYKNIGGVQGTLGDRTYDERVTTDQLEWLKSDLSYVSKQTPVVVCMHAPYFQKNKLYNDESTSRIRYNLENYSDLNTCLAGYDVTILSGHAHINSSTREGNITEYNVGGVNGTLWYTGQSHLAGNHLCRDGSVGGYLVMEKTGTTYTEYYKSMGYDRDYQFRAYDLNNCRITAAKYCPNSTDAKILTFNEKASDDILDGYLDVRTDNKILLNIFAYNERWKYIKATENGKALTVKRVNGYDPLHIISLACKLLQIDGKAANEESVSSGRLPNLTAHMFEIQAATATGTVTITACDEFGRVYTQEVVRPKELATDMQ